MTGSLPVFVDDHTFGAHDSNREPSISAFDGGMLPLGGVPSPEVFVALSEADGSEREPHEEPENRETMHWWNQQRIHKEEVAEEPHVE